MPAGRPTKYNPSFCQRVPELMRDGLSHEEVSIELGICYDSFCEYRKLHHAFSDAVKEGDALSRAWWTKQGRIALREKEFNATLWYMNMKNRHGWRDKIETDNKHELTNADWIKKLSDQ